MSVHSGGTTAGPRFLIRILLLILLGIVSHGAQAALIKSIGSGNWTAAATWINGIGPACGDSIVIQATHTVALNTATFSSCTSIAVIIIYGVLEFPASRDLTMACGSYISLMTSGKVKS